MQLCGSLSILWHCLSLGLKWKLTFSSPVTTAEFSQFAGILSAALSQHHLSGFEITQLEFLLSRKKECIWTSSNEMVEPRGSTWSLQKPVENGASRAKPALWGPVQVSISSHELLLSLLPSTWSWVSHFPLCASVSTLDKCGDNSNTYLIELLWECNGFINMTHLKRFLAHTVSKNDN